MKQSKALRAQSLGACLRAVPATVLALLACAAPALAGDPLRLEVVDDATGEPLREIQAAVLDPTLRTTRGKFERGIYDGPREAGDVLYVYCRDYDLGEVNLGEETRVAVRLRGASGKATVVLRATVADGWSAWVHYRPFFRRNNLPFSDAFEVHLQEDRFEVVVPEGMRTTVVPKVPEPEGISWPVGFTARAGGVHEVHVDRGRDLALRWGEGVEFRVGNIECLPDVFWEPDAEPIRVDAWRWRLNGPGWLRDGLVARGPTLRLCPDVPFHLFAVVRGAPFYRHVAPGAEELDLRARPLRSVGPRPVIEGRVLAEGAMLAPGRLHLDALSTLRDVDDLLHGVYAIAGPEHEAWGDVRLPPAPWLTAWDPARGVAHLRWDEGTPVTGSYGPGTIDVATAPGHEATGMVAVFPVWKGTGSVRTTPPLRSLARRVPEDGHLRFPGLPLGTYGVSVNVDLVRAQTGHEVETEPWFEVTLTRAQPSRTVQLAPR